VGEQRVERKLAAILAADVVGYSRLMGADEEGTLTRLKSLRCAVFDPKIREHHGHIVKTTGDGILVEFPSVVEAVQCAVEVQQAAAEYNVEVAKERRLEFRAGINLGDIIIEGGDIYGDGVNVAARLESLAEPGGVCLSGTVYEHVRDKLPYQFADLGDQRVKNIARPIRVYSVKAKSIAQSAAASVSDTRSSPTSGIAPWRKSIPKVLSGASSALWGIGLLAIVLSFGGIGAWLTVERLVSPTHADAFQPRGPTVAVLAFDNLSGDPAQEAFVDGFGDELITALSKFGLRVIARNTTFAYKGKALDIMELGRRLQAEYVVEGSFRRNPDQITINAQLIDARIGTHVWAQNYERSTSSASLVAIQDEFAQLVSAAVGDVQTGAVARHELERTRSKSPTELSSYECFVNASQAIAIQIDDEIVRRARTCLEATVKRDPTYPEAWESLTHVLALQRWHGAGLAPPDTDGYDKRTYLIPRVVDAGNRAVDLAPDSAQAHFALFTAYTVTCETERMRVEAERVLAINPNDAVALGVMGNLLSFVGMWDYGRPLAEKGIRLAGPAAPRWWWEAIAKDYYRKGEYEKALEYFRRSYVLQNWLNHLHLAYTLPYLGRTDEARAQLPILLKLKPDISIKTVDQFYKMFCFDPDLLERIEKGLRLAGLREEVGTAGTPASTRSFSSTSTSLPGQQ
jgi:adenylate cyclase